MNVSLTPELEILISKKVESGRYTSASEVVREALRLLEEQDTLRELRRDELRKEILKGVEQMRNGQYTAYSLDELNTLSKEISRRGRAKLEAKKNAK